MALAANVGEVTSRLGIKKNRFRPKNFPAVCALSSGGARVGGAAPRRPYPEWPFGPEEDARPGRRRTPGRLTRRSQGASAGWVSPEAVRRGGADCAQAYQPSPDQRRPGLVHPRSPVPAAELRAVILEYSSMSPQRWERIQQVFLQAVEFPENSERVSFLDRVCYGDLDLRLEVDALLASDTGAQQRIECAIEGATAAVFDDNLDGQLLGAYRVSREIGRGGMGSVYLGQRADS